MTTEGRLREVVLSPCAWWVCVLPGQPESSRHIHPGLLALGLDFSASRAVHGTIPQLARELWSSGIGSLPIPDCIFSTSFIYSFKFH